MLSYFQFFIHVLKMAQAKAKQKLKGRNVSVPLLSSDDANVNTSINTKNDGSKCCGKCNKIVKDQSNIKKDHFERSNQKRHAVITVVCGFTLNIKVLLMKFISV